MATESDSHLPHNLDLLQRITGLTDTAIAAAAGVSRGTWENRKSPTKPTPRFAEVLAYAQAFGVPVDLLEQPPSKVLEWIVENRSDLLVSPSTWRMIRAA